MRNYLFVLLFLLSCNGKVDNKSVIKKDISYDYEVLYNYEGKENKSDDKYRFKLSSDTLYIILESIFNNDRLMIKTDKIDVFNGTINTNPTTGTCPNNIIVGDINNIKSLFVRINNGPKISIELIRKDHNIIGIRKSDKKVKVIFYKSVPRFE